MSTEREMNTKVCCKCKEVKTLDGFSKDKAKKDGHHSKCKACKKEYNAKCYAANPERIKEKNAKWCASNPEKKRESNDKYYAANPEKIKEYQAEYRAANPEKGRAKNSNRRAAKSKAIPSWLTQEDWQAMEAIGKEADRLTKETGIKYEVDHIHPLRGKLICGLQCPDNLQILTKSQNCSKGNRFTPYVESEL